MRLFIAINLPKKEKERIHRSARPLWERELPVHWIDPVDYHVVLKPLGSVGKDRIEAIGEVMDRVGASTAKFPAEIASFGAFPTIRRPEVLWAGIAATPELRCLKQDLEWGLADLGFPRETRAFHPHIALGRATGEGGAGAFRGVDELVAEIEPKGDFVIWTMDLVQLKSGKSGSRYDVLRSTRLSAD